MRLAVFSRTYNASRIDEVCRLIEADGFQGTQLNLGSAGLASLPPEIPFGIEQEIASASAFNKVPLVALSGTYNMIHPDVAARRSSRSGFRNVLRVAKVLSIPIVTLCTGSRDRDDMWRAHPDNSSVKAWSDLRRELDLALELAMSVGVRLAIEPEPANVVDNTKTARKLLDEVGSASLGIVLDAANLLSPALLSQQKEVMSRAVDLLGGALFLAHAKDMDGDGKVVAPGRGSVDFKHFLSCLRSVRYEGPLVAHGFPRNEAAGVCSFLKSLLEGAE